MIDVGFGVSAVTTAEWAERFPSHRVIGLELDAARVAEARVAFPSLTVLQGDVEALEAESASVVRIANVARGLTKDDSQRLHERVAPAVRAGGLCLEGSTDVEGHLASFFVLRKQGATLRREALVFETDGARGFSPWMFRDVLPRALRRDVKPGSEVHELLTDWAAVWETSRTADALESFRVSAARLEERRRDVSVVNGLVRWALAAP